VGSAKKQGGRWGKRGFAEERWQGEGWEGARDACGCRALAESRERKRRGHPRTFVHGLTWYDVIQAYDFDLRILVQRSVRVLRFCLRRSRCCRVGAGVHCCAGGIDALCNRCCLARGGGWIDAFALVFVIVCDIFHLYIYSRALPCSAPTDQTGPPRSHCEQRAYVFCAVAPRSCVLLVRAACLLGLFF